MFKRMKRAVEKLKHASNYEATHNNILVCNYSEFNFRHTFSFTFDDELFHETTSEAESKGNEMLRCLMQMMEKEITIT